MFTSTTYLEAANVSNLDFCPRNQGGPLLLYCAHYSNLTHILSFLLIQQQTVNLNSLPGG